MPNPRLAISQITTTPLGLARTLELARRHGFALEIAESQLTSEAEPYEKILRSGVEVVSLQPATLTPFPTASAPEPRSPADRIQALKGSIERCAKYWPGRALVTNTGALPTEGDEHHVWEGCVAAYRELAAHAERHGMRLALEALGPSLMNRNSILYTYGQALEMVEAVGHPAFGACLDLYNSWQDPMLADVIACNPRHLFLVQLADWRRPRSFHDRRALGQGHIDLRRLLKAIAATGYAGPYVLEIFSEHVPDSLWASPDVTEQAILQSLAHFDHLIQSL